MPRFFCPASLDTGQLLELPAGAARHVQVLRLQPGDTLTLFNHGPGWVGDSPGGEFEATVTRMARSGVQVQVGAHVAVERETARQVHLGLVMPANERMDWLVEKATELGATSIQPLMSERSVLRLTGERANKKVDHWQSVAIAACEQSGRNRVPRICNVMALKRWLLALDDLTGLSQPSPPEALTEEKRYGQSLRLMLSLRENARSMSEFLTPCENVLFLSGPEGGLSTQEEDDALAQGFIATTLGPRILRAETAPLAALAALTLLG